MRSHEATSWRCMALLLGSLLIACEAEGPGHQVDAHTPEAGATDTLTADAGLTDGQGDAVTDAPAADLSVTADQGGPKGPNPCPEGQYLNLRNSTCQKLARAFGFQQAGFQAALGSMKLKLATADCNYTGLLQALAKLGAGGGGTLTLPACKIPVDNGIDVPDNSVLQGAGIGKTELFVTTSFGSAGSALRIFGSSSARRKNIVLRDFTIRGRQDKATNNITFTWADNILVERVESTEAGKSAFHLGHCRQVTVRYCENHHSFAYHGIGAKDCFVTLSMDGPDADKLVSKAECSGGVANYWTADVAYYSNKLHHNAGMGLDSHSSSVEVAGNLITDNMWSSKFPQPASDVWVHHNLFDQGTYWGASISNQYDLTDTTMDLKRHVYYSNRFSNHGAYGIRIRRISQLYFMDNEYVSNAHGNALRITGQGDYPGQVFFCPGDQVGQATIDGDSTAVTHLSAGDLHCDLSKVGQIF